jgi:hypothetical protein
VQGKGAAAPLPLLPRCRGILARNFLWKKRYRQKTQTKPSHPKLKSGSHGITRLRATIPNSVDLGHPSFGYLSPTFIGPEFGVVSWFLLVQGWVTVFSHGPPLSRDVSASWLAKLSYFEMCKLVHKVQKLNDKYRRTLKPTQLHTYFHQLATLELKDKANGQFNRSVR